MKKIVGISNIVSNSEIEKINSLWDKFFKEDTKNKIKSKISGEIYSIYTKYSGDYTSPYKLLIGYEIPLDSEISSDFDYVIIPNADYEKTVVKGQIPQVVVEAWQKIWQTNRKRAYKLDYDRYLEDGSVEINVEYLLDETTAQV